MNTQLNNEGIHCAVFNERWSMADIQKGVKWNIGCETKYFLNYVTQFEVATNTVQVEYSLYSTIVFVFYILYEKNVCLFQNAFILQDMMMGWGFLVWQSQQVANRSKFREVSRLQQREIDRQMTYFAILLSQHGPTQHAIFCKMYSCLV